jgi:hypothetical protein
MPWRLRPRRRTIQRRPSLLLALSASAALGALVIAEPALAHVEIDVGDGQYVMEIGFRDEPAYLGQPNALWLQVEEYATGGTEPVDGLAETLTAEVSKDGQTKSLTLVPAGEGVYEGAFIPTATGDYTFRIGGTIGEAAVDETVTSGPTTFASVEPLTGVEFPVARPDPAQLAATVTAAQSEVATARLLGIAGLVAGLLGLLLGAVALTRAGRRTPRTTPLPAGEPTGKLIR